MATKFRWKQYFSPTPKRIRIFGDSLAAASTLAASIAVLNGSPQLGTILMIAGWTGKFLSNFFTDVEEKPVEKKDEEDFHEGSGGEEVYEFPKPIDWESMTCEQIWSKIDELKTELTFIKNEALVEYTNKEIAKGGEVYLKKGCDKQPEQV